MMSEMTQLLGQNNDCVSIVITSDPELTTIFEDKESTMRTKPASVEKTIYKFDDAGNDVN